MASSGGGGGSLHRTKGDRVVERLKAQNATRKFKGISTASGTQTIQGAINPSDLASSRTGVGRVRGVGFVPMLPRVWNNKSVVLIVLNEQIKYKDRNQWTANGGWRSL